MQNFLEPAYEFQHLEFMEVISFFYFNSWRFIGLKEYKYKVMVGTCGKEPRVTFTHKKAQNFFFF